MTNEQNEQAANPSGKCHSCGKKITTFYECNRIYDTKTNKRGWCSSCFARFAMPSRRAHINGSLA